MKLHIAIVVMNCFELTRDAVNSIVSSIPYTLHIIDQGSTDDTKSWAEQHQCDRFFYHRYDTPVSLSEAWNRGIKEAIADLECKYIFIPNNDVLFHKTTIDNLIKGMNRFNYAMVTGDNVAPRMSKETMYSKDEWGDWNHDARPITSYIDEGPDFSCWMIKRDFIEKYGWFDENFIPAYCEDQCCHIRIRKLGGNAKRLSVAPYYHIASQTLARNPQYSGEIHEGHNKNKAYYREKWGTDHALALEGQGYHHPYNDQTKSPRWWRGVEKYKDIEKELFGKVFSY